jgi:hypothetical protein
MAAVFPSFIQRLPMATPGLSAAVKVVPMQYEHAVFWHAHVQPIIDGQYTRAGGSNIAGNIRADVGWDWTRNFALMALNNLALFSANWAGRAQGYALLIDDAGESDIPIGMLTMVPQFDTTVHGVSRDRTFTWYLSDAPSELYDALNVVPLKLVAKALLDTSIIAALIGGLDGESLLHADPAGGTRLLDFYEKSCKMTPVPRSNVRISKLRSGNTGGYFLFEPQDSLNFTNQFSPYR